MKTRCDDCVVASEDPIFNTPTHLVHPEHGRSMVFDVYCEAVCPDCGSVWRRGADNKVVLL
jgi:hypothetical protein